MDLVALDGDGNVVSERFLEPVGLEGVPIGAIGKPSNRRPHRPLAASEDIAGEHLQIVKTIFPHQVPEPLFQQFEAGDLRPQIALGLIGGAHGRAQQFQKRSIRLARGHEVAAGGDVGRGGR